MKKFDRHNQMTKINITYIGTKWHSISTGMMNLQGYNYVSGISNKNA